MIIVEPYQVGPSSLVSTDVPENDYPVWSAGTAYTAGQKVMVTSAHRNYEALGNTTGDNPTTSPTKWLDIGPTNRWALFDTVIGTTTTKATSFTYTIQTSGRVNAISFLNVLATSIRVVVEDYIEGVVYDSTVTMTSDSGIQDWYAYFFTDITRVTDKSLLDLPGYLNPKITFTVTNASAAASVGVVVMGYQRNIGRTQYGSSIGITDYSVKSVDQFGNYTVVERPYSAKGNFQVMVSNGFITELKNLLNRLRATPILVIGTECYEATTVYGFYRDYSLDIAYFDETQLSLEMEGLT